MFHYWAIIEKLYKFYLEQFLLSSEIIIQINRYIPTSDHMVVQFT